MRRLAAMLFLGALTAPPPLAAQADLVIDFGSLDLGGIAESTAVSFCFVGIGTPPVTCGGEGTVFLEDGLAPPFHLAGVFREVEATGAISLDTLPATLEPGERLILHVQWVADRVGPTSDVLGVRLEGDDPDSETFEFHGTGTASGVCPFIGALCLGAGGRFKVEGRFLTNTAHSGVASTVQLTQDTGFLWFFNPDNVEAVIKVLNGCSVNNRYWVFAGGLTNVRTLFAVADLQTSTVRTYINPQNRAFRPIQDTSAFATCP